ncbi:MAG: DUF4446 family protein [Clostridia bacterium]|nr:DUF4446 family protein [Clostridia bacterium]
MNIFNTILSSSWFNLLLLASLIILLVLIIINLLKVNKLKNDYKKLMELVGKGEDFNEIFNRYINEVKDVSRETLKIKNRTENLEKNLEKCVQKVGIIRYNAYRNSGSDLCFAVALLDFEDNGVVLNGIYSRDNTTTTYAKPIEHGKSKYTLVKEEEEAIELAKHNGYKCFLDLK